MEPEVGTLQFVWIAGHRRRLATHDDYFTELVEHLIAVTPDIDGYVSRVIRRYRRRTASKDPAPVPDRDTRS